MGVQDPPAPAAEGAQLGGISGASARPARGLLRGAYAALAPAGPGTRTLAIGSNARELASVARLLGGDAAELVRAPAASLDGGHSASDAERAMHAAAVPFPFGDASFDTVLLHGELEWTTGHARTGSRVASAQEELLRECRRVLRPGGALIAVVENRYGIATLAGQRHASTGIRWFSLIPRPLHLVLPGGVRERARAHRSYSWAGWAALLRRAGFEPRRWWTLWPAANEWRRITPSGHPPARALAGASASLKERVSDRILQAARGLGAAHPLAPNYLIVARASWGPADRGAHASLLDQIVTAQGARPESLREVLALPNSESLGFSVGGSFIKVALTAAGRGSLERDAAATMGLTTHAVARHAPLPTRIAELRGVPYLTCPMLRSDPGRPLTAAGVEELLDALACGGVRMRLADTEFWRRVSRDDLRERAEAAGAASVIAHVERCGDRRVLAGVIHGDLHPGNLIVGSDRVYAIDWDYGEAPSPHFLDVLDAAKALLPARLGRVRSLSLAEFVPLVLRRDPILPLADRLFGGSDELSVAEMVCCYVLQRLETPLRETRAPWWFPEPARSWFRVCENALAAE